MDEEINVEALQAQIDLSNSVTYDLVTSWMKSGSKKAAMSVSSSITRELEESVKRPPRLGLGASVSKASAATAREAAKLKGKLTGTKRGRYEDIATTYTSTFGQIQEEEDGESRSAAISTKRAKVNGAAALALGLTAKDKGKARAVQAPALDDSRNGIITSKCDAAAKKQHREEDNTPHGTPYNAFATPPKSNPFVMPKTPPAFLPVVKLVSTSPLQTNVAAESPSDTGKKKKRKHKKFLEKSQAEEEEEWLGFSADASESSILDPVTEDNFLHLKQSTHNFSASSNFFRAQTLFTPSSVPDMTPTRPASLWRGDQQVKLQASPPQKLLNLDGPPLEEAEDVKSRGLSESPKRQRHRHRGKKCRNSQAGE